jgi:Zn-dependent protease
MYLNLGLCVFNLLPFPPLDVSKIFRAVVKGKAKEFLYDLEQYSWIIITILFFTHIASYIISPVVEFMSNNVLLPISDYIISSLL